MKWTLDKKDKLRELAPTGLGVGGNRGYRRHYASSCSPPGVHNGRHTDKVPEALYVRHAA